MRIGTETARDAGALRRLMGMGASTSLIAAACALEPTQFLGTLIAALSSVLGLLAVLVLVGIRSGFALKRGWARAFHPHTPDAPQLWGLALAAALCLFLVAPATVSIQRINLHRAKRWLEALSPLIDAQVERTGKPPASLGVLEVSQRRRPWLARVKRVEYRVHAEGAYSFEISAGLWSGWSWHSATRRWVHYG